MPDSAEAKVSLDGRAGVALDDKEPTAAPFPIVGIGAPASGFEEVRAANEELQSSNGELQSSNEELGTTKEELKSANEELSTVNEELDTRNQQLSALNDDLTNLFGAVNMPILRVDRDLRLRRFNPAAEKYLRLFPADLDRPIRDLQSRLGVLPDAERLIRDVIDVLNAQSYEIQDPCGRWWSVTLRPYYTSDHRLDGAVLTFRGC